MVVHKTLGPGFLESVYKNALAYELSKSGLSTECERRIPVFYDGVLMGEFAADMIVADAVLVETKAVADLSPAHEAQVVHYLAATGMEIGLLINFGATSLQYKRKNRTYRKRAIPTDHKLTE